MDVLHVIAPAETLLNLLRLSHPIVVLLVYLVVTSRQSIHAQKKDTHVIEDPVQPSESGGTLLTKKKNRKSVPHSVQFSTAQNLLLSSVSKIVILTWLANFIDVAIRALAANARSDEYWGGEAALCHIASSLAVYIMLAVSLLELPPSPTMAHVAPWIVASFFEATIAIGFVTVQKTLTTSDLIPLCITAFRIVFILAVICSYAIFLPSIKTEFPEAVSQTLRRPDSAEETIGLLGRPHSQDESAPRTPESGFENRNGIEYGTITTETLPSHHKRTRAGWEKSKTSPNISWLAYLQGYALIFPYLWPTGLRKLQAKIICCIFITLVQRFVNAFVPIQIGVVVNLLANSEKTGLDFMMSFGLLSILWSLQGEDGLLGFLRNRLWIPVGQYSFLALSTASFDHVQSLSLGFHVQNRVGEVISALSKGSAVETFLSKFTFFVVPQIVDVTLVMAILLGSDYRSAFVFFHVMFLYGFATIRMAGPRADAKRSMTKADRDKEAVAHDSIMSYDTVKYFGAEPFESKRYRDKILKMQDAEYDFEAAQANMNFYSGMISLWVFLIVLGFVGWRIKSGSQEVGQFVTLLAFMKQLQAPLNSFGTFYRQIQSALINAERLLELFKEQPDIVDASDAMNLLTIKGDIVFHDVQFEYDSRKPALRGLSFTAPAGTTTALVGESGGGKSTVFRLMFRYYKPSAGTITVDGYEVSSITANSLRSHIGVVPQDVTLFHESIMYNLRYAKQDATDDEVHTACRAASIHDKIMNFPDGYDTVVGERGLRLSGGEKQRLAIARAIIKNPAIILLDEATAALDTETEGHIQEALATLTRGRTTLVVAHRLSTITHADQILVIHNGMVEERGTHDELLEQRGRYWRMWSKQGRVAVVV